MNPLPSPSHKNTRWAPCELSGYLCVEAVYFTSNYYSTSITLFRTIHYMQIAVVGLVGFVIADEALLLHQVQNGALALLGGFQVVYRIVVGRGLRHAGQHGSLA